jgi:hypothetical protein
LWSSLKLILKNTRLRKKLRRLKKEKPEEDGKKGKNMPAAAVPNNDGKVSYVQD